MKTRVATIVLLAIVALLAGCTTLPDVKPLEGKPLTPADIQQRRDEYARLAKQFDGTPFLHDNELARRQCESMGNYCDLKANPAVLDVDKQTMPPRFSRTWEMRQAIVSPDDSHLIVTVCQREAGSACTLKRYDIRNRSWSDLPGLEADRGYFHTAYHPDGKSMAVTTWECNPQAKPSCQPREAGLWLIDAQGGKLKELIGKEAKSVYLEVRPGGQPVTLNGASVYSPAFHPDGRKLAYWRSKVRFQFSGGGESDWHLYEMDLESGKERRLDQMKGWGMIRSGPRYALGGKLLFVSSDFGDLFAERPAGWGDRARGAQYVMGFELGQPITVDDVRLYIPADKTYHQFIAHDTSYNGRYLLYSSQSVAQDGGGYGSSASLMLYDLVEQRAVKKIWEGAGYLPPQLQQMNQESLARWGKVHRAVGDKAEIVHASLSRSLRWGTLTIGTYRGFADSRRIYLANLEDRSFRAIVLP